MIQTQFCLSLDPIIHLIHLYSSQSLNGNQQRYSKCHHFHGTHDPFKCDHRWMASDPNNRHIFYLFGLLSYLCRGSVVQILEIKEESYAERSNSRLSGGDGLLLDFNGNMHLILW